MSATFTLKHALIALILLATGAAGQSPRPQLKIDFVAAADRDPIPFRSLGGLMLIRASIAGRDSWVMLDNRAEDSAIDLALARELKLKFTGTRGVLRTATGTIAKQHVADVPIAIAGQMRFRTPLSAIDLTAFSRVAGHKVDGILGRDYFAQLVMLVDSDARQIEFGPSGSARAPLDAPMIALQNDRPQILVASAGKTALLTLDLGYNGSVRLGSAAWARLIPAATDTRKGQTSHAEGRLVDVRHARLASLTIGPVTRDLVDVSQGPTLPRDGDGVLGMGFLRRTMFMLDIKARKLWLIERNSEPAREPSRLPAP